MVIIYSRYRWFDRILTIVILANALMLTTTDYSYRLDKTANQSKPQWREILELIFTVTFILEFLLKIIGMGFILEPGTYLRDGWNVIDFIVVVSG